MGKNAQDGNREYNQILERAMTLVKQQRPDVSAQKHAAFANAVAYLVTGWAGGYGGPSVREHAASWQYGATKPYTFEKAVELLLDPEGVIFGAISDIHRRCWESEHCFDDDPDDVRALSGGGFDASRN